MGYTATYVSLMLGWETRINLHVCHITKAYVHILYKQTFCEKKTIKTNKLTVVNITMLSAFFFSKQGN